jgi:hypothetical protein
MSKFNPVFVDILCFIIGPVLIAYNLFNFSRGQSSSGLFDDDGCRSPISYYYYYSTDAQLLISFGVALVCWGFLRLYWENNK